MVEAVLIELDQALADQARATAAAARLRNVEVRHADAGDPASSRDALPVDVLMLCGIFGNLEPPTVRGIVRRVPALVASGGYVIWTRGSDEREDHRAEIRRWFIELGMPEVSFEGAPERFGVGVKEIRTSTGEPVGHERLFTFRTTS